MQDRLSFLRSKLIEITPQGLRFLSVGGLAAVVDLTTLWLLHFDFSPTFSFSVAYVAGVCTHYFLNKLWTFRCARTDHAAQIAQYLLVIGITYVIQFLAFQFCLNVLGFPPVLAKACAIPPGTLANFYLMRKHVFDHKGSRRPATDRIEEAA